MDKDRRLHSRRDFLHLAAIAAAGSLLQRFPAEAPAGREEGTPRETNYFYNSEELTEGKLGRGFNYEPGALFPILKGRKLYSGRLPLADASFFSDQGVELPEGVEVFAASSFVVTPDNKGFVLDAKVNGEKGLYFAHLNEENKLPTLVRVDEEGQEIDDLNGVLKIRPITPRGRTTADRYGHEVVAAFSGTKDGSHFVSFRQLVTSRNGKAWAGDLHTKCLDSGFEIVASDVLANEKRIYLTYVYKDTVTGEHRLWWGAVGNNFMSAGGEGQSEWELWSEGQVRIPGHPIVDLTAHPDSEALTVLVSYPFQPSILLHKTMGNAPSVFETEIKAVVDWQVGRIITEIPGRDSAVLTEAAMIDFESPGTDGFAPGVLVARTIGSHFDGVVVAGQSGEEAGIAALKKPFYVVGGDGVINLVKQTRPRRINFPIIVNNNPS